MTYSLKEHLNVHSLAGIGTVTFFENFVLLDIEEGVHLGYIEMEKIHSIVSYHFEKSPYAYISNRNISYSMNPITYSTLNNIKELKCIAMFKNDIKGFDAKVEAHFLNKPIKVFSSFEHAANWVNDFFE